MTRDAQIVALYDSGMADSAVAREFGITRCAVAGVISRARDKGQVIRLGRGRDPFKMTKTDLFADALSEGMTIAEASRHLGISSRYGSAILSQIRQRLGPQAV